MLIRKTTQTPKLTTQLTNTDNLIQSCLQKEDIFKRGFVNNKSKLGINTPVINLAERIEPINEQVTLTVQK